MFQVEKNIQIAVFLYVKKSQGQQNCPIIKITLQTANFEYKVKYTVTSIRETSRSPKTGLTRLYCILMPMKECLNNFEHHNVEKWWSQDSLKLENLVMPIKRGRPKGKSQNCLFEWDWSKDRLLDIVNHQPSTQT